MIKRIRYVNDHVLLESINSNYEPIFVKRDEVEFAYKIVWTKGG
jgi:SOS-response transcriptional repressor LexA